VTKNPHPAGSLAAASWDLVHALDALAKAVGSPVWEWLEARSFREHLAMIGACFAALFILSIVAGTFLPIVLGIAVWFLAGRFGRRR
jgi:hypothetical protein